MEIYELDKWRRIEQLLGQWVVRLLRERRFSTRKSRGLYRSNLFEETLPSVRKRVLVVDRIRRRGGGGMFIAGSYLPGQGWVAASHRSIFIIRPFVFPATARPESNNTASPRRPRSLLSLPSPLSLSSSPLPSIRHLPHTHAISPSFFRISTPPCYSHALLRLALSPGPSYSFSLLPFLPSFLPSSLLSVLVPFCTRERERGREDRDRYGVSVSVDLLLPARRIDASQSTNAVGSPCLPR